MTPSEVKATLSFSDGSPSVELPIYKGTVGPDVIDIRKLYGQTGKFTYDPGFMSTASCNSKITYIDGDKGELLYRGYAIDDLASKCDFMEICYLLLKGELPNAKQKEEFNHVVTNHTMVHEQMQFFLRGFRRDAHPMAVLTGLVGAMSAFYPDAANINDPREREISQIRLIAKLPTLVAMAYKYNIGQPLIYPQNNLSYTGNFMRMMFATPCEDYKVNPVLERALDRIFILHADHEQNASTSTVRLAGSSGTNPIAAIAAGIACLWGPAHGGANEAALNMLEEIGSVDKVPEFIKQVKDKNSGVRLMGFGHRVYKNYDPRATAMQKQCHAVLDEVGHGDDPLLKFKTRFSPWRIPFYTGGMVFDRETYNRLAHGRNIRFLSYRFPPMPDLRDEDVTLRLAEWADFPAFFRLKCDVDHVVWSGHTMPPLWDRLSAWYANHLNGGTGRRIFIAECGGLSIGYAYLDDHGDRLEVTIGVATSEAGRGIGRGILRLITRTLAKNKERRPVEAWIFQENLASVKAFEAAGFVRNRDRRPQRFDMPLVGGPRQQYCWAWRSDRAVKA